jgi:hypothetical protein
MASSGMDEAPLVVRREGYLHSEAQRWVPASAVSRPCTVAIVTLDETPAKKRVSMRSRPVDNCRLIGCGQAMEERPNRAGRQASCVHDVVIARRRRRHHRLRERHVAEVGSGRARPLSECAPGPGSMVGAIVAAACFRAARGPLQVMSVVKVPFACVCRGRCRGGYPTSRATRTLERPLQSTLPGDAVSSFFPTNQVAGCQQCQLIVGQFEILCVGDADFF